MSYGERTSRAVGWLLECAEPATRLLTRGELLGEPIDADAGGDAGVDAITSGPMVRALLSGQQADGGFGHDPYRKWTGVHWRLIALAELAVPATDPRVAAAAERVLSWMAGRLDRWERREVVVAGLPRTHAGIEGNALGACSRLGLADDPRARRLAEAIVSWQWPDGGWNCDRGASGYRSDFHETLGAAWGLHEYAQATGHVAARDAGHRAAELFLEHQVFRRLTSGEVADARWLRLRYPPYWHYDILQALLLLSRMGKVGDPRAIDALDELERRRLPDGRWRANGRWWKPADSTVTPEVVAWDRPGDPNPMLTLNALRVLRAADRLD